jgi:hypothetical protein
MIKEISNIYRNITCLRIHESGDFYNQEYLERWKDIADYFPGLTFYTYTKSELTFEGAPDNMKFYMSADDSTTKEHLKWIASHSYPVAWTDTKWYTCKECDKKEGCLHCTHCMKGEEDVHFEKH